MYLNTFLLFFGLDPDNFVNELVEPFRSDQGEIIYNLRQKVEKVACPYCGCIQCTINNYSWVDLRMTINAENRTIIIIKKVRFKCKACKKTILLQKRKKRIHSLGYDAQMFIIE